MKSVPHRRAELAIVLVAASWGTSYVAMKIVTESTGITDFLFLRFVAAAVPMTLIALPQLGKITWADLRVGMWFGALLFVILHLETQGVHLSSAANAGFLIAVNVAFIPIIDAILFRTRTSPLMVAVLLFAIVGTALTTLSGGLHLAVGDALILGAALLRGLQTVLYSHQRPNRAESGVASPVRVTIIQMWTVAFLALAAGGFRVGQIYDDILTKSATDLFLIGYLGVVCTALAFLAQLWAGPRLPAVTVGLILASEPVFAGFSAVLLGGEALSVAQAIGGAMIVVAVGVGRLVCAGKRSARLPD